ncbi:DUF975 family protein [Paenibacillus gallinarum]|uniref:DUF975 family protein n=1 Tax=Paenibacillus gallinarum TaxID=2762232 RepID=A0ABR8T3M0_9BACL|nr:DUF975 family protein [Paenibacillus gallinarum]MBD7970185.1 DUF975 family protein [Paenibacillus gallinarum]
MGIMKMKHRSLDALKGNWGKAILLTVLISILTMIIPTAMDIQNSGGVKPWLDEVAPVTLFSFVYEIVLMPFYAGIVWFYISLVRKEKAQIRNIFKIYPDGRLTLKLIWTYIVMIFFISLWTLLLIVPGIIKSISYSQTLYVLRDHPEYSATQAITESRRLMDGYKWKFVLFHLSFIGWFLLTAVTFGLAWFFVGPYFSAAQAVFYEELKDQ